MAKRRTETPTAALRPALPTTPPRSDPQATPFARCPGCGSVVLVQEDTTVAVDWHNPQTDQDETVAVKRWIRPAKAKDPVLGYDHEARCDDQGHPCCPASKDLRPLWIKDGKGGERFAWVRLTTGELLDVTAGSNGQTAATKRNS